MSYRSLKRAFGETNLERKCRLSFGICLLLLIGGAFWWVNRISENLIHETTRRIGRDWANVEVLVRHWEHWDTDPKTKGLAAEVSNDLLTERHDSRIISFEAPPQMALQSKKLVPPASPDEERVLRDLERRWREQLSQLHADRRAAIPDDAHPDDPEVMQRMADGAITPVFAELRQPEQQTYVYYQPVYWRGSCLRCHERLQGDSLPAADIVPRFDPAPPFRAVAVNLPYSAMQEAVNSTRAILLTVAILTVVVAMVTLYLIVRYVIVKPLNHLRDVSDAISRGNAELRASIRTGDEFEELAASFNRMIRHLTDAQTELRRVNADLDTKVDQLAQVNMQLYEANRLKSDFLANMSHELRTPLNSIIGFSEVLSGIDSLNDKQKRYARNIQKSGRVLLDMINDILDLAKLEAGKMDLRPSEFRLDVVLHAQCDMVRSLSEQKNIDLTVQVSTELPPLFQDQGKVQQVLTNLLSNAIKFTPEGGRVAVAATRNDDGQMELTVADTGVGIAEEDREVIFEKFRQAASLHGKDGLTREYSGTGLGLSIVKELCKLLGGEVSFVSELGKGSTFKVVIPWSVSLRPGLERGSVSAAPDDAWDAVDESAAAAVGAGS